MPENFKVRCSQFNHRRSHAECTCKSTAGLMLTTKGESASVTVKVTSPVARGRACWFKRSEVFKDLINEIPVEVTTELMVIWGDVSVKYMLHRMQVVDT
jgi:hypothetical protein